LGKKKKEKEKREKKKWFLIIDVPACLIDRSGGEFLLAGTTEANDVQ